MGAVVLENSTDQILVEQAKQGDQKSFDLLCVRYQHRVAGLISRYVKNHSDVLDVTQETFIKVWRSLPNFRGDSAFYTWLYRIAVNTAKNHLVSETRKYPVTAIYTEDGEQIPAEDALSEDATPESLLSKEQLQEVIFETINGLPADLRTAILLREIDGLSYDDIASVMDCPVGTVRSRIFRAREAIDEKIQPFL